MSEDRLARIRAALETALSPLSLDLVDESYKHVGHEGARDGRGHFRVRVVSAQFSDVTAVARHRKVYAALGDLMQTDIHALAIDARAPHED